MYKVSAGQTEVFHDDGSTITDSELNEFGVMITVKPPIDLLPAAVRNYLTNQFLYDEDKHYLDTGKEIQGVQLLGSTDEATSIYVAAIEGGVYIDAEQTRAELVGHTIKLIELLGSSATHAE